MPELPEVETIVRKLNAGLPVAANQPTYPPLPGCTILAASADWPRQIHPSVQALEQRLPGHSIQTLHRRGKYLVLTLQASPETSDAAQAPRPADPAYLLIHLKMSGRLEIVPQDWPRSKHDHVILGLDNGHELRFNDTRKFGRVYLVSDPAQVIGHLGPEPLDDSFTLEVFRSRLADRSGALKPLLLDQAFLAGIGNIYADEALWRARLHPRCKAPSLSPIQVADLYQAIRDTLRDGIQAGGSSIDGVYPQGSYQDRFRVYGLAGQPCPRCQTLLERSVIAQRSTYFCPRCQA